MKQPRKEEITLAKSSFGKLVDCLRDFWDERNSAQAALNLCIAAMTDAAAVLDAAKQEWILESAWSDFDQAARDKISAALKAAYANV